jgi:hypothetical protein
MMTWSSLSAARPDSNVVCRIDGLVGLPGIFFALQTVKVFMYLSMRMQWILGCLLWCGHIVFASGTFIYRCVQHNGDATLLIPPENLSLTHFIPSNAASVTSTASRSTVQYQRRFRLQGNPSLTDLRSMQCRLRESVASSSSSFLSSASSGIPGIGYLSGKGIKWVGLKMLDAFSQVELYRRRQMIPRLVARIRNIPADERTAWIVSNRNQIYRSLEDILELSSYVSRTFHFSS